jgi:hypothetical protein
LGDLSVIREKDVDRLDVSMSDIAAVKMRQCQSDLQRQREVRDEGGKDGSKLTCEIHLRIWVSFSGWLFFAAIEMAFPKSPPSQ